MFFVEAILTQPQSNQRGIETTGGARGSKSYAPGLNRTSVGLKPAFHIINPLLLNLPQSNQRGIETESVPLQQQMLAPPQSNQRGIETVLRLRDSLRWVWRLNRTSVGLKLVSFAHTALRRASLNRTSVGLKPDSRE